ncbi:MAG TPA: hypothetical protein VK742_09640 [Candidatus Sulfotelmatobacter sp.]|jgi:hypothetical protein|nr:hypothetical protein [Candidatus Sulfotelmatobacter sp.]HXB58144.1 hypothetical protein [Candidatus Acidoferrales bacterium]
MSEKDSIAGYLDYSSWWIGHGSDLHKKNTEELRSLVSKFKNEGLSSEDAFKKALNQVGQLSHPNQECCWEIEDKIKKKDAVSWEVLKSIIEQAPHDEKLLNFIGAGPFEDWISEENFNSYKEELQTFLKTNQKWKIVVKASWHNPNELEMLLDRQK